MIYEQDMKDECEEEEPEEEVFDMFEREDEDEDDCDQMSGTESEDLQSSYRKGSNRFQAFNKRKGSNCVSDVGGNETEEEEIVTGIKGLLERAKKQGVSCDISAKKKVKK